MPARLLLGQGSPQADFLPLLWSDRKENTPGERRLQRGLPLCPDVSQELQIQRLPEAKR